MQDKVIEIIINELEEYKKICKYISAEDAVESCINIIKKIVDEHDKSEIWWLGDDNMEEEIKIINRIIFESVKHGADAGGSYDSNGDNLIESVEEWLKLKGLQNDYTVEEQEVKILHKKWNLYENWSVFQIVKR